VAGLDSHSGARQAQPPRSTRNQPVSGRAAAEGFSSTSDQRRAKALKPHILLHFQGKARRRRAPTGSDQSNENCSYRGVSSHETWIRI